LKILYYDARSEKHQKILQNYFIVLWCIDVFLYECFLFFQNLKNQIMTTNVWVEQVSITYSTAPILILLQRRSCGFRPNWLWRRNTGRWAPSFEPT